jgi:hypothetical protein
MTTPPDESKSDTIVTAESALDDLAPAIHEAQRLIATAEIMLERAHALLTDADAGLRQLMSGPPKAAGH